MAKFGVRLLVLAQQSWSSSSRGGQTVVLSYVLLDPIRIDWVSEVASWEGRAQHLLAAAWRQRTLLADAILQGQTCAALEAPNAARGTLLPAVSKDARTKTGRVARTGLAASTRGKARVCPSWANWALGAPSAEVRPPSCCPGRRRLTTDSTQQSMATDAPSSAPSRDVPSVTRTRKERSLYHSSPSR